jgi:hypothetical protein
LAVYCPVPQVTQGEDTHVGLNWPVAEKYFPTGGVLGWQGWQVPELLKVQL